MEHSTVHESAPQWYAIAACICRVLQPQESGNMIHAPDVCVCQNLVKKVRNASHATSHDAAYFRSTPRHS